MACFSCDGPAAAPAGGGFEAAPTPSAGRAPEGVAPPGVDDEAAAQAGASAAGAPATDGGSHGSGGGGAAATEGEGGEEGQEAVGDSGAASADGRTAAPCVRGLDACSSIAVSLRQADSFTEHLGRRALLRYFVFYTAYLLAVTLLGTIALCVADPEGISPVDGLFLTVSTLSMTGLSPVNFAARPRRVQVLTWAIMLLSSPMLLSIVPVILRRLYALRQKVKEARQVGEPSFWSIGTSSKEDALALTTLYKTVFLYWLCGQLLGAGALAIILHSAGTGGPWDALFLASSAWHNVGLTTLSLGLPLTTPEAPLLLPTLMLLILLGNTCFPLALRVLIWSQKRLARDKHRRWVLVMLLRHPRRCYTHLFPYQQTMWLALVTCALVVGQIAALCAVHVWAEPANGVGDSEILMLSGLSTGERVLAICFHAVSTRTAGFQVLDLEKLSPAAAFVFMVCMWISTSPVVVTMRSTAPSECGTESEDKGWRSVISTQFAGFMNQNSLVLVALLSFILLSEEFASTPEQPRDNHFLWTMFEFCSAYGTSGLSMTGKAWSQSGEWTPAAKLCLVAVMLLGRLRGLPEAIDPAVRLHIAARMDSPRFEDASGLDPLEEDVASRPTSPGSPGSPSRKSEDSLGSQRQSTKGSKEQRQGGGGSPPRSVARGPQRVSRRRPQARGRRRANSI